LCYKSRISLQNLFSSKFLLSVNLGLVDGKFIWLIATTTQQHNLTLATNQSKLQQSNNTTSRPASTDIGAQPEAH